MDRREALKKGAAIIGLTAIPVAAVQAADAAKAAEKTPINGVAIVRYPIGKTEVEPGKVVCNSEIGAKIANEIALGCVLFLPSARDEHGNFEWDFSFVPCPPRSRVED